MGSVTRDAVKRKLCLRCDWEGETAERACPDCEASPLFVPGAPPADPPQPGTRAPANSSDLPTGTPAGVLAEVPKTSPPRLDAPSLGSDDDDRSHRLGRSVLAASLGGVALLLLVTTTWLRTDEGPPSADGSKSPAVTTAVGFLDAYGRLDADEAISYLAPDADLSLLIRSVGEDDVDGNLGEFRLLISLLEAWDYQHEIRSCGETETSEVGTVVRCHFDYQFLGSDALGLGPYTGSSFDLLVRDGEIGWMSKVWAFDRFSAEMWQPFATWVSEHYPADAERMYQDHTHRGVRLDEGSIRRWARHTDEYAEVASSQPVAIAERFMEARNAYDADEAMSLIAGDGARVQLLYDNRTSDAINLPAPRMDRDELALALEAERIYGVRYDDVQCGPSARPIGGGEAQIECSVAMGSLLRQIHALPPVDTSFHLGVHDGEVTFLSFPWLNATFPDRVPAETWGFLDWLQVEHPEAGAPMRDGTLFETWGQEMVLILTPRSLDLLETSFDAYARVNGW